MEISLDTPKGNYQINSYQPGNLVINQMTYQQSLIISPKELIVPWRPQTFFDLQAEDLELIAQKQPEVFLLGTGASLQFPSINILSPLIQKNIGYEIMSTSAACRTFMVLAAENRNVIAGLIIS